MGWLEDDRAKLEKRLLVDRYYQEAFVPISAEDGYVCELFACGDIATMMRPPMPDLMAKFPVFACAACWSRLPKAGPILARAADVTAPDEGGD